MASHLPATVIDSVLQATDLVALIGACVSLKQQGREWRACCPFHEEKTPSFYVNPDKQLYHCFGCGVGGNAIGFQMAYEQQPFVEAVQTLAERCGMDVRRFDTHSPAAVHPEQQSLLEAAQAFFQQQLAAIDDYASKARAYLKDRGISTDSCLTFSIGLAREGWHTLEQAQGRGKIEALLAAGLSIRNEQGKCYDRFRGRIMFPIHSHRGQLVGFGGRVFQGGEPKYLNSPETELFHKSHLLYGLYQCLQQQRRPDCLLLVEGYMDVISLHQAGLCQAIATLGTAASEDHLRLALRHTDTLVLCFDGDKAGRKAAERAMHNALPLLREDKQLRCLFLPEGEDPDSLVQAEGIQHFRARITAARPMLDTLLDQLDRFALHSVEGRSQALAMAQNWLQRIHSPFVRIVLQEQLAEQLRLPMRQIQRLHRPPADQSSESQSSGQRERITPMRALIALLLEHPQMVAHIPEGLRQQDADFPGLDLFQRLADYLEQYPQHNAAQLLEHWRDTPHAKALEALLHWRAVVHENKPEQLFMEHLTWLQRQLQQGQIQTLLARAKQQGLAGQEKALLARLLKEQHNIAPP